MKIIKRVDPPHSCDEELEKFMTKFGSRLDVGSIVECSCRKRYIRGIKFWRPWDGARI